MAQLSAPVIIALVGTGVAAAGTAISVAGQRKAAKQSKRQARIRQQQANVRRSRERARQRREVLRRRAAAQASAEARGVGQSSLAEGTQSSLQTQFGANMGFLEAEGTRQGQNFASQMKEASALSLSSFGQGIAAVGQLTAGFGQSLEGTGGEE